MLHKRLGNYVGYDVLGAIILPFCGDRSVIFSISKRYMYLASTIAFLDPAWLICKINWARTILEANIDNNSTVCHRSLDPSRMLSHSKHTNRCSIRFRFCHRTPFNWKDVSFDDWNVQFASYFRTVSLIISRTVWKNRIFSASDIDIGSINFAIWQPNMDRPQAVILAMALLPLWFLKNQTLRSVENTTIVSKWLLEKTINTTLTWQPTRATTEIITRLFDMLLTSFIKNSNNCKRFQKVKCNWINS